MVNKGRGARPPSSVSWMMGKNVATIYFVQDVMGYLETCTNEKDAARLNEAIERVMKGELSFSKLMSPEEFLASPE